MFRLFVVSALVCGVAAVGAATANAAGSYSNCTQAHQDGRSNIPKGDPDYWSGGDRDGDGIACES
jgi:excalibur calcium-binding domain-containing protein